MGKGRPRAVERGGGGGILGQNSATNGSMNITPAPVYYPTEEEFKDPLEYIYKIRPEAESYGICKIIPPKSWKPPFALDLEKFSFPTKTQAIHQLQARPASCDSKTFELEYNRFLETHCGGRKPRRKVVFEGDELDLCKLFNAVKRFGGYDKVAKAKRWGEVFRFVRPKSKISECAKHVLAQLYLEHLYEYEEYYTELNNKRSKGRKRGIDNIDRKQRSDPGSSKKRQKGDSGEAVKVSKPEKKEDRDQICEQCKSGLHGEVMLLCDRCNKGWHIYCLSPPLDAIPPGNWYCLECLNSDEDSFGFVPGKCLLLEAFRKVADRTKKKWFGSAPCSRLLFEKKFWEIVEGSLGEVEVMYGSDLDTSQYGSGFPRPDDKRPESIDAEVWNEYCNSPWNLNNLPKLRGSMLRAVHHSIAGVMVPWLYMGMLFSAFCWHFEDHCFYSMNYHHWGEPKCWYSVPGSEASAFEKVMRSCLPDLFDAQPDLLFQLVTMLNPSVLQDNGVPVYSVLQEPGNFVITFPRSYHGGFNLGLNCAEAVNFAPADWLPHGGFGSELYKLYHKPAVISHEELLCVAVKIGCDAKVAPYMNKELVRIFSKEKLWREKLWKKGLVKTSVMSPKEHPDYVGTEEDPTCIICQQYLYLSAVTCRCRPSTYVCLEHWERLCECIPKKRRLLYRHSLAELNELLVITENVIAGSDDNPRPNANVLQLQNTCSTDSGTLTKKVKGKQISLAELAEEWLLSSCKIFKLPFSSSVYASALKDAQQFLWAGHEMDPVRDVVKNLAQAKDWAERVRTSLSAIESWSKKREGDVDRVHLRHINNLLKYDPVPCDEPGHLKLKEYAEAARLLVQNINEALSKPMCSMAELESLVNQSRSFPICIREGRRLAKKIPKLKVWLANVDKCILETTPASIDIEFLRHLKAEMLDLQLNLPENEKLLDLIGQAELCQAQCKEMLQSSISLEKLELLIHKFGNHVVNIPELKLLQQYHEDTVTWLSRFNNLLLDVSEREDQKNVVKELRCIQKDGIELKVQVDELALVEVELKKACCREKALKVWKSKTTIEFVQQVLSEAAVLHVEGEELFVSLSKMLASAFSWEERSTEILAVESKLEDFEDALRTSEDIPVILPSLPAVKEAVSTAKSWLKSSKPFLQTSALNLSDSNEALAFEDLKELASKSRHLKVKLAEKGLIENILTKCEEWRCCACSSLKDVEELLDRKDAFDSTHSDVIFDIEQVRTKVESVANAGHSLGFAFSEISLLCNTASIMKWCSKVLIFRFEPPTLEDIDILIKEMRDLSAGDAGAFVFTSLVDAVSWLKKAAEVLSMSISDVTRRFHLDDVEDILMKSQDMLVSFPAMISQIEHAIKKHKLWQEEVRVFFSDDLSERSWSSLLQLKELGKDSFDCVELDMIMSEFETIGNWKQRGEAIVGCLAGDATALLSSLLKIKQSLHRSLYIYEKSRCWKVRYFCIGCSSNSDDEEFIPCSTCKDCYHLRCLIPKSAGNNLKGYTCPYCVLVDSGSICRSKDSPLKYKGKRPELEKLVELSSDSKKFTTSLEESDLLQEILEQALSCRSCLSEIVDSSLCFFDKDVSSVSGKLTIALKALDVAGVCDSLAIRKFDQALARNSWRIRASKLVEGSPKPVMQQVQRHLKEGSAINVPPEDYFWQKLTEMKQAGIQWAETAKKVASDGGDLELDKVFELIAEGESLPIHFEKELKLLRTRSVLYCICRKPYDQRPMIACDECDEWYHFDCVNMVSPPETYFCPACKPQLEGKTPVSPSVKQERSHSAKESEPQTPSPRHVESRWRFKKGKPPMKRKISVAADRKNLLWSRGFDKLLWRNKKPFRRTVKKRTELGSLSPFFLLQQ